MASFTATTFLTTQQSLLSGEIGYVTRNGGVLTTSGVAVSMTGAASLTVFGAVASGSHNAISGTGLIGAHINIMDGATVAASTGRAVYASAGGICTVANAGQITGLYGAWLDMTSASTAMSLANSGDIQALGEGAIGVYASGVAGSEVQVNNTGVIGATGFFATGLWLSGVGSANVNNSGVISVAGGSTLAIDCGLTLDLRNTGTILGGVHATGASTIWTAGQIIGPIDLGNLADNVQVSGMVDGSISLGNGTNTFVLSGGRVTGTVAGGSGNDHYIIDRSDVVIFDGSGGIDQVESSVDYRIAFGIERLTLTSALGLRGVGNILAETLEGNDGADTLLGLDGADQLIGGQGDNRLYGGRGDDELQSDDGNDLMQGGLGNDTILGSSGTDTVGGGFGTDLLFLDTAEFEFGTGAVVNLATGNATIAGFGSIRLSGIENVQGTQGADSLTGSGGANVLGGSSGDDTISAGAGDDRLSGGTGVDVLTGGTGADGFVFAATSASSTSGGIDHITDFEKLADMIDLSGIDAVAGGGDDAFVFIGSAAFAGAGPQVRAVRDTLAGTTTIEVKLANSASVDMTIILDTALVLTASQFEL